MAYQAVRCAAAGVSAVALFLLAGCGGGLNTSAVSGKVVFEGGDLKALGEGAGVEFQLESDPKVRASGEIKPDGSFELVTLHNGKVQEGAAEGTHLARIFLPDYEGPVDPNENEDEDLPPQLRKFRKKVKRAEPPIPEKYLNFNTSGWKVTVPTDGSVTLTITPEPKKK